MEKRGQLVILIGPKGSGKTFIGSLMERELGVCFLRVEPLFLDILNDIPQGPEAEKRGYKAVSKALERCFGAARIVVVESTGASSVFPIFLEQWRARYQVLLVAVRAPLDVCLERVRSRDRADHIAVSDDRVKMINRLAAAKQWDWDLILDNHDAEPGRLVGELSGLLPGPGKYLSQG